jgi:hypothetical protein
MFARWLADEWGFSDAFAWQENYIAAKVDGLNSEPWRKSLTSWYRYEGDDEGFWVNDYVHPGTTLWASLRTQNWFPKDEWVFITVGTTSWQRTTANDMQMYGDMRFTWFIKSVTVMPR